MGRNNADFNEGTELVPLNKAVGRTHHGTGKKVTGSTYKGLRAGSEFTFEDGSTGIEHGSRVRVRKEENNG